VSRSHEGSTEFLGSSHRWIREKVHLKGKPLSEIITKDRAALTSAVTAFVKPKSVTSWRVPLKIAQVGRVLAWRSARRAPAGIFG